jgi:hypothetical protein
MQGLLLRDGWLDLGAPAADDDPKRVGGDDGGTRGSTQADECESEDEKCSGGEQGRWLPAKGEEISKREAGAGREQWNPAKPERLDDRGIVQPGCGSTDSRHEKRYLAETVSSE